MAWTAPRTWVAGERPTAAIMNLHIRDNLTFLRFRAGNAVLNTDASGRATVTFADPFTAPPVVTASGGNGEDVWIVSTSATTFVAEFRQMSNNALIVNGPVRVLYIAVNA